MVEGFQHTEIGTIPNDWEMKTLTEIGETIIGLTYSPSNVKPNGTLVLRSSNVQEGKLAFDNNVFVEMDLPERVIVKENDLLICVRNGSRQLIGKCALIDKKTEGSAFGAFMSIYRSPYSVFVFHQFQSYCIQRQINQTLGATINQLTNKDLASFKIPLPPTKTEQTAIATALNDADALIQKLEHLIAKKRNIKTGAMQELLKPKKGWEENFLTEFVDYIHGKAHEQYIDESGKYVVVNSKFISSDGTVAKYSNQNYCPARKGDILTVLSDLPNGKALAKCFYVETDKKYAVNQRICIWRSKGSFPKFLFYVLNRNKYFIGLDDGISQTHILNHHIEKCRISIPKDSNEQIRIAQILSDIDNEIQELEKQLEKYKMMKQGMMQSLLTGKIRLV